MKEYGLNELRSMFLEFYESKGHLRLDSFSLIPHNDKSLLLINSGMAPLKPYFTGQETPPRKRVTTCQKCIRTPDIENVGKTARHGTFFEMLGNFSFGDYFKKEAIAWAWEFLTEVVGIPEKLLYVTVYEEDDEAFEIWEKIMGLPKEKIVRMGKEDNFWEIGLGPCGPCSEIYFDRGEAYGCGKEDCYVGCDCDRYVEIWNLVFTQFDKDEAGNYNRLKHPNIDTGMGLERLAVSVQGVDNLFEVDTVRYILDFICKTAKVEYKRDAKTDVSIRVITDHIRSVVFMLSDGVIPSNEGRGYVLRRLFRRAVRHGKLLGVEGYFMTEVAKKVVDTSADAYPALKENYDSIMKIVEVEEIKFNETIAQGMELMKDLIDTVKEKGGVIIEGEDAFRLYDTFGFPLELTLEIAEENGLTVDTDGFHVAMKHQKKLSSDAHSKQSIESWKDELTQIVSKLQPTQFTGYRQLTDESEVLCLIKNNISELSVSAGDECLLIVKNTPFYAQSGGQVGDIGTVSNDAFHAVVKDVQKSGDKFIHFLSVTDGTLSVSDTVYLYVDESYRMDVQRNHTSTHLLHKALKIVLGNHVNQAGSEVSADKLRFDFSHFEKMTDDEIKRVELIVNQQIGQCTDVDWFEADINEAKNLGATALFGEKYGTNVRVVKVGDFSMELCGGCHLNNIGFAGLFKILSESGVAAGVRRIEAVTGRKAYEFVNQMQEKLEDASHIAKTTPENLLQRIKDISETNSRLQKEVTELKHKSSGDIAGELIASKQTIGGMSAVIARADGLDIDGLRTLSDQIRDKLQSGAVFLVSVTDGKGFMLASATKDIVQQGFHAGNLVKAVAQSLGGGGGGRADMAQSGMKDISKADEAVAIAGEKIKELF